MMTPEEHDRARQALDLASTIPEANGPAIRKALAALAADAPEAKALMVYALGQALLRSGKDAGLSSATRCFLTDTRVELSQSKPLRKPRKPR
ncbi:MAG TPA: hypothetical protein VGD78_20930 [Chthoniobacterales bacterium]